MRRYNAPGTCSPCAIRRLRARRTLLSSGLVPVRWFQFDSNLSGISCGKVKVVFLLSGGWFGTFFHILGIIIPMCFLICGYLFREIHTPHVMCFLYVEAIVQGKRSAGGARSNYSSWFG